MKKLFTLLCVALVSAVGFAQDAYDPSAHTAFVSGTANLCSGYWTSEDAMTYDAKEGLWKITLSAKDTEAIEFKIVYDGSWYGQEGGEANYKFQVEEPSDVNITFDPKTMIATYSGDKVKEYGFTLADVRYIIVAGSGSLLNGLEWNIDETEAAANKMTAEETGYYTLALKGIAAGTYEFKFVANGSWSAAQWGAIEGEEALVNGEAKSATADNGKNFKITLDKGALYDVTLTLDIMDFAKPAVTAEWQATGDAPIEEDVYSLAGTFNNWDKDDEGAELTKVSEGVYSFTRPVKAGTYEFKIVKNHDWSVAYPADNYVLTLEKDADVTISLDITGEPTVLVTTAECSVYFVAVKVQATEDKDLRVYACYSDEWKALTGSWPGERMNYKKDEGFVTAEDLLLPKGEKLWLIFNDNNGHQTANIEVTGITSNTTLEYILNDEWAAEPGTGIQAVASDKQDGIIYNLAGQRVEKAIRGLYIINGKKVLVK